MTTAPRILHRTPHEALLIKPAGQSSELPGDRMHLSTLGWARRVLEAPGARLPHRLDRLCRGILVVALDADAAAWHGASIQDGAWSKTYLARLGGDAPTASLVGAHRVHLRTRGRRAEVVRSGGRPALLDVLDAAPAPDRPRQRHALIRLVTGRYHQIRATMAHLGAPLAGDALYGGAGPTSYLEHAALRLPLFDGSVRTWFDAGDADRERVDDALLDRLRALAGEGASSPAPEE